MGREGFLKGTNYKSKNSRLILKLANNKCMWNANRWFKNMWQIGKICDKNMWQIGKNNTMFECIFYYNFYILMKRQVILNIIEKKGRFQKIKTISHLSQRKQIFKLPFKHIWMERKYAWQYKVLENIWNKQKILKFDRHVNITTM